MRALSSEGEMKLGVKQSTYGCTLVQKLLDEIDPLNYLQVFIFIFLFPGWKKEFLANVIQHTHKKRKKE